MKLSLKNRIAMSFVVANIVVLTLGFLIFNFFDSLNKNIEAITVESNRVALLTDEIRISTIGVLKYQRRVLTQRANREQVDKLINLCEGLTNQLQNLDALYKNVQIKQVIAKMLGYVDSLKLILKKASFGGRSLTGLTSISDLADKILEAFSEFQDIQYYQNEERDKKIKDMTNNTKRHMMYTLIITFVGAMLLGLVVPGKMALPFKKLLDAIRELQDCNFDVSIFYDQEDEIGEIAREMNKMIASLKYFEELRADRINIERRKFDALANMVNRYVLVANASGQLIYMNNQMYSLLQVQSDDIIFKDMEDARIPHSIKNVYKLAIKRRSKLENEEIDIPPVRQESEDGDHPRPEELKVFATVIPVRGKENALDYYLMVLSRKVLS